MKHELQLASDNTKIERICHTGRRTRRTNCTAAQRITTWIALSTTLTPSNSPMGGGHTKQTAPPPNELQLPCPLKNQMISRCAIMRTNELQPVIATRHFSQTKPRGGRAKTMKQPCAATLPPNELQCGQRRQHCHSHNQGTTPPRTNMHTKGRAPVQTTTRTTAASPDARRRHGPYIAPTAAPA